MYKILFVLFLLVMSVNVFSQTAESIANQAKAMGITSQEDILKELQKRGMTVEDAKRMALINGIDYNDYINQYILKNTENNTSNLSQNVVSEIILDQNDTILQEVIESIDIETDAIDILSYFG